MQNNKSKRVSAEVSRIDKPPLGGGRSGTTFELDSKGRKVSVSVNKSTSMVANPNKENQHPNITLQGGKSRSGSPLLLSSWNKTEGVVRKPAFARVVDLNCSFLGTN